MKNLIAVSSITYAVKAQELLRSTGISCHIVKTPKDFAKGCGYSLSVSKNVDTVLKKLDEAGISYKDVRLIDE